MSQTNMEHPPAPLTGDLTISGMNCANCARHVTEAI